MEAAVGGLIDVGFGIVDAVTNDGGVGGLAIEVTGFNLRDFAPGGHLGGGGIGPVFAVVGGDLDEAVVGADPDHGGCDGRGADGVDDAEAVGHLLIDVFGGDGIEVGRKLGFDAGEVGRDFLPGFAAIAGAKDELVGVVEGFVGGREDLGEGPGFAIGIVGGQAVGAGRRARRRY